MNYVFFFLLKIVIGSHHRQDNIAVVVLATWPICSEAFDGMGGISGPVPILFTAQPAELRSTLNEDPDSFYPEINKFMSR